MRKETIKHENLRRILSEVDIEDQESDNFKMLLSEIKHSCLIIPGIMEEDGLEFLIFEKKEGIFAPLFTEMDEFRKVFPDGNIDAHEFNFVVFKNMVETMDFDGFIINVLSESFTLPQYIIELINELPKFDLSDKDSYSSQELKQLKDSIDNEYFEKFIENPSNIGKYEELIDKMSSSTMLTLMLARDDLSDIANDGIINTMEYGPIGFLYTETIGGNYATMYTSEAKMNPIKTPFHKYSQIVDPSLLCNLILNDDMDGIIINPQTDNVLLNRDVLLEFSLLIEETCNNPKLNLAIFNMFEIEGET